MSVELHPSSQLGFQRPFNQIVKRILQVTNNHAQPVAFKVKTTAPKLYCVRPNSGRIEAGETVDVAVLLQPMKEEPPLNAKCKDKFLVQTTFITPDREKGTISDLWSVAEKASDENRVHQQKIKVAYLPPEGDSLAEEPEHPSQITEPGESLLQSYQTVRQGPMTNGTNGHASVIDTSPIFPIPVVQSQPDDSHIMDEEHGDYNIAREELTHNSIPEPPVEDEPEPSVATALMAPQPTESPPEAVPAPAPEPVTVPPARPAAPAEGADASLLAKYAEAQAEIERLRTMLAAYNDPAMPNAGLRKRSRRSDADGVEKDVGPADDVRYGDTQFAASTEGVPPLVVIMIALGVFITTYLFF